MKDWDQSLPDSNSTELDYFNRKVPNKTYVSKRIDSDQSYSENGEIIEKIVPIRYASKVINSENSFEYIKEKGEIKIRITSWGRQEIVAKFLEDTRGIYVLQLQKFTTSSGSPHQTSFSFRWDEIKTLVDFIKSIKDLHIEDERWFKITDNELKKLILTKDQAFKIYRDNEELFREVSNESITKEDIVNLVYRKEQLYYFWNLLNKVEFFEEEKIRLGILKDEALWQGFFERNTWIFWYGLSYVFNSALEDKKLEQVISGFDFNNSGKRIDALMKTRGFINSFCLGEIKTHKTPLLREVKDPYRGESWAISNELGGAIAQIQKSAQKSIKELSTKVEIKETTGDLTGEQIFIYQPKSFVIIGNLKEFISEKGVNEDKFSSFELFRQNQTNPEIITFDELYERAKYIVKSDEEKTLN